MVMVVGSGVPITFYYYYYLVFPITFYYYYY